MNLQVGMQVTLNLEGTPTLMEIKGFDNQYVVLVSIGNGDDLLVLGRKQLEEDLIFLESRLGE